MIRLLCCILPLLLAACAPHPQTTPPPPQTIDIGIIAINDFHGNLEPPHQSVDVPASNDDVTQVPAGGVAYLASAVDSIRAKHPNHVTVSAGDLISGAPFLASLYLDEPTIGAMNRMGLDISALGNHEFDRGRDELLRLARGGCGKFTARTPCAVEPYTGAKFQFLAANTFTEGGDTLFPSTTLKTFGGASGEITIGFIGLVTNTMPQLIPPDKQAGLHWADEADTANALVPKLLAAGADAIVVIIHQGGTTDLKTGTPNNCDGLHGTPRDDIRPILARFDPRIDVVISGHTHWAYVCDWPSARDPAHKFLLTSAGLWGKLVTDISLGFDAKTHHLTTKSAHNVIVQSAPYFSADRNHPQTDLYPRFTPRPDIAAYLKTYTDAAQAYAGRIVGWLSARAEKTTGHWFNTGGPLGQLIADGQLAATIGNGAQIAFMNPFGVRASINPAADGSVSFAQINATQPFNDTLVTQSYTGAEIKAILEQGFDTIGPEQVLTPSAGFSYHTDRSRPIGNRISQMMLNGQPINPTAIYRVTTSTYLAKGGDTFTAFTRGTNPSAGPADIAALESWLKSAHPRNLPTDIRWVDDRPDLSNASNPAPPGQVY